jgi:hypothetical protein
MIGEIEDFKTGWYGMSLRFSPDEIDRLILLLGKLKEGKSNHFHLFNSNNFANCSGIADVELSMKGDDEIDNMRFP